MIFEDYSQLKPDNKERYSYFYQSNKRSYNIRGDSALHKQSVIYKKYENIEYKTLKDKVTILYPNYRVWHNNIKEKELAIFIEELLKNKYKHMDPLMQKIIKLMMRKELKS